MLGKATVAVTDGDLSAADLSHLTHADELALMRKIAEWPRLVEDPAFAAVQRLFDDGTLEGCGGNSYCPFADILREDAADLSLARLALIRSVQLVIAAGLGILGVTPVNEM